MAFTIASFIVHNWTPGPAGGLGRALASYVTNDSAADLVGENYFNAAAALVPVGSQIFAAVDMDGTAGPLHLVVATNAAGVVTVLGAPSS